MTATMPRTTTAGECWRHMSFGDIEVGVVCRPGLALLAPTRMIVAVDNCRRQGDWDVKLRKLRELGPRWVRVTPVEQGHRRSPTVTHDSEKPQVAAPAAHAAGMMHTADSDLWSRRSGVRVRWAALSGLAA